MSAHIEVIDQYLEELVDAAIHGDSNDAVDRMVRIHGNYEAALRDVATYHKWFIDLRDGKGGWAEDMAKLREENTALRAALRAFMDGLTGEGT